MVTVCECVTDVSVVYVCIAIIFFAYEIDLIVCLSAIFVQVKFNGK